MTDIMVFVVFLFSSCGIEKSNNSANDNNSQFIAQSDICLYGCPIAQNIDDIIVVDHDLVKIAISKDTKFAKWVAYKVEYKNLNGSSKSRNFKQDPKLDDDIALSSKDYKDAYKICNYDRGHIAPLATFSKSDRFFVVNYLSNITPQNSSLNRTSWKYLEEKERELVNNNKYNKLYILAGTYNITNQEICQLPNSNKNSKVPHGFFKIIAAFSHKEGNIALASFIFKNQKPKDSNFCNNVTTIDNIETLTNINIMPASSNLQNNIALLEDLGC